jgi:hypothetical protein
VTVDDVAKVMIDAAALFGGDKFDGTFNLACFSTALARHAGVLNYIDGKYGRAILAGRRDVVMLSPGDAHFQIRAWRRLLNSVRCQGCAQHVATRGGTRLWGIYCARCRERERRGTLG